MATPVLQPTVFDPQKNFVIINGVPCTFYLGDDGSQGGISMSVPREGPQVTVTFQCDWNSQFAVIEGLMGSVGVTNTGAIDRVLPLQYPPLPQLFCTSIGTVEGVKPRWDSNNGFLSYEIARFPAYFSSPGYDIIIPEDSPGTDPSGITFCTTKFRTSAEVFSPPVGGYFYPDGKPVYEATVGFVRPRVEISMMRHLMPFIPLDTIMNYAGTVNSDAVTFEDREFPRGCLIFTGGNSEPISNPSTGTIIYEVEFTFLGNYAIEWNMFMNTEGKWVKINSKPDGSGFPPFRYTDFTVFFGNDFPPIPQDPNIFDYIG